MSIQKVRAYFKEFGIEDRIREFAGLPNELRMTTYVDVGYPDQTPYPPQRLSVEDAIFTWKK